LAQAVTLIFAEGENVPYPARYMTMSTVQYEMAFCLSEKNPGAMTIIGSGRSLT
jgi:hypothetical protein